VQDSVVVLLAVMLSAFTFASLCCPRKHKQTPADLERLGDDVALSLVSYALYAGLSMPR